MNGSHSKVSEEDIIAHLKVVVLQSMRNTLVEKLDPVRHMDFLRSKFILSEEDCDEIKHPPSRRQRASKFLDILDRKGAEAFDALCSALKEERTQTFLLCDLNKNFERRYMNYKELIRTQTEPLHPLDILPPCLKPAPPLHEHFTPQQTPAVHLSVVPCQPDKITPPSSPSSNLGCSFSTGCATMASTLSKSDSSISPPKKGLDVSAYLRSLSLIKPQQEENGPVQHAQVNSEQSPSSSYLWNLVPPPSLPRMTSHHHPVTVLTPEASVFTPEIPSCTQAAGSAPTNLAAAVKPAQPPASRIAVPASPRRPRLSPRGSLNDGEPDAASATLQVAGNVNIPRFDELISMERWPRENDEQKDERFFSSIQGGSLLPSLSGLADAQKPLLCSTALSDQEKEFEKCSLPKKVCDCDSYSFRDLHSGDAQTNPSNASLGLCEHNITYDTLTKDLSDLEVNHATESKQPVESTESDTEDIGFSSVKMTATVPKIMHNLTAGDTFSSSCSSACERVGLSAANVFAPKGVVTSFQSQSKNASRPSLAERASLEARDVIISANSWPQLNCDGRSEGPNVIAGMTQIQGESISDKLGKSSHSTFC